MVRTKQLLLGCVVRRTGIQFLGTADSCARCARRSSFLGIVVAPSRQFEGFIVAPEQLDLVSQHLVPRHGSVQSQLECLVPGDPLGSVSQLGGNHHHAQTTGSHRIGPSVSALPRGGTGRQDSVLDAQGNPALLQRGSLVQVVELLGGNRSRPEKERTSLGVGVQEDRSIPLKCPQVHQHYGARIRLRIFIPGRINGGSGTDPGITELQARGQADDFSLSGRWFWSLDLLRNCGFRIPEQIRTNNHRRKEKRGDEPPSPSRIFLRPSPFAR
mmetsp:Transcript_2754/g.7395  ORF Transcript_2754/g.7395 Transcript_2754/m.7395 type:complete len:271 (-) Transcript_2754:58-870(-)